MRAGAGRWVAEASSLLVVEVHGALERCGGAASWRRLRALGVTWYSVWAAVLRGQVVRLRRGAYALHGADAQLAAAVSLGGVLSCVSAAAYLGLPVLFPDRPHVTVPRSWSHARLTGVRVHRRDLMPDEHDGVATGVLRTVVDCARELSLRDAVVICDAALHAGGLALSALHRAAAAARGRGATALRSVAALADGRAESPIETCLRLLLRDLADVVPQVWIPGVGRVDLLLDGWLVVEADGFAFHSTRNHYRDDRRRANALMAEGYTLLRFSYEDVVHHSDYVVATVLAVLAQPRSQPSPTKVGA